MRKPGKVKVLAIASLSAVVLAASIAVAQSVKTEPQEGKGGRHGWHGEGMKRGRGGEGLEAAQSEALQVQVPPLLSLPAPYRPAPS